MKIITTKVHGMMDYMMGALLILSPWIFDFSADATAQTLFIALGCAVILYSLLTNYELGAYRTISMNTHLMLDLIGGILLAISPWLFGFSGAAVLPAVILGILEIGASLMTERHPSLNLQKH